jgi:Flp pilus assembly pilin Flp
MLYYLYLQNWIAEQLRREEGQDLAEYALLVALIAIAIVAALIFFRGELETAFSSITDALSESTG